MTSNNRVKAELNSELNSPESYQFSLLEEKLKIARRSQKVGEVIIYKEVETKAVSIPIRREKLIVKRIGKNPQKLTEITLSEENINGFNFNELNHGDTLESHQSNFISLAETEKLLTAIKQLSLTGEMKIRLEFASNHPEDTMKVKEVCNRF